VFEEGAFDDQEISRYSLYTGASCPNSSDQNSKGVGWDTSHGTRQPVVFAALFETREQTGMSWPDEAALAGLGRGFAYGVFEGDLERPRLRNFLDGSNGWYDVIEKTCSGYPPFGLSIALLYGAWGRYTPFAPEVGPIVAAARRILLSEEPRDIAVRADIWDKARYNDGQRRQLGFVNKGLTVWMLPILSTYAIGRDGGSSDKNR
jgi:hypothetical protein